MAGMGVISRTIDKLPTWAQAILAVLGIAAIIYGFAHEGRIHILKVIFSPEF
jgi:hypothetical protein